jgi:hypothetical protein
MIVSVIAHHYWKETETHINTSTDKTPLLEREKNAAKILVGHPMTMVSTSTTTKAEHQMEGSVLLNSIVRKGAAVLQLPTGKEEALLCRARAVHLIDLHLNIVDDFCPLNLKSDGLST